MTTKLGPKDSEKKQKAKFLYVHICNFFKVEVAMTNRQNHATGKSCFDCL